MVPIKIARPGLSFLLGIAAFCLMGVLVLLVRSSLTDGTTYEQTRAESRITKLIALRRDDRRKLTRYAWADKAKGVAQISIDRAMDLTASDLKAQPVVSSTVKAEANTTNIVPPSQQPAPAAATPAPSPAAKPAATAK